MEQKMNLLVIIKIVVYAFLSLICHFNKDASKASKSLSQDCNIIIKLDIRNCRCLAKYKNNKDLNNTWSNEKYLNSAVHEQKDISNNIKGVKGKKKDTNKNFSNMGKYYIEVVDNNNGMFDGKYFHFEKKLIKKKDYDNYIEKKRRICDISLKKLKFRNYGYVVAVFFIISLFGIGVPVMSGMESLTQMLTSITSLSFLEPLKDAIAGLDKTQKLYLFIAVFSIILIELSIIVITVIYKILRNNEKYNKIKLMNEQNK
ncbi:hypothetical protein MKS88_001250 [Plasmodium brasilianum]|uniref:Uncharacterized protein n=1 Tax=Plasmodium brasilianum TaxID=5824 RepID=A0ACB9YDT4_PLABR|nr:hypothetical protein MKS88_001250 [Plasmodium brasilianum]